MALLGGMVVYHGCPQRASGVLRIIPPGVKRYDIYGSLLPDGEEYIDVMYCGVVGCKDKMVSCNSSENNRGCRKMESDIHVIIMATNSISTI